MPPQLRPAVVTAVAAALFGLLIATIVAAVPWIIERSGTLWTPFRDGAHGWLVAHGSGVTIHSADIRLIPLGATFAVIVLIAWVTVKTVVDPIVRPGLFVLFTAIGYAVLAGVVCVLSHTEATAISTARAVVSAGIVAAIGSTAGIAHGQDSVRSWWAGQAERLRAIVRGAFTGAVVLLFAAFVLVVVLFAEHLDRASDLWSSLDPGLLGGVALGVICLALLPNAVLWTASALIGPGFELGTNTSVDLTGAHLGVVPDFPLLAALPSPGRFSDWVFVLALVPLFAGVASGWTCQTASAAKSGLSGDVIDGSVSGAVAGFVVGVLVAISGGSIGPGRMADVGPPVVTPVVTATLVLALGGAIGALLGHYRVMRAAARN